VREGRRQEFAKFPAFADVEKRSHIPDPNDEHTFRSSVPAPNASSSGWLKWTSALLAVRHAHIIPRLAGARAIGAAAVGPKAVAARWRMGDGTVLSIAVNLADTPAQIALDAVANPSGADLLFETEGALASLDAGHLPAHGFVALLEPSA
jgi:maltooligosyltrehalose trehalohydrolase